MTSKTKPTDPYTKAGVNIEKGNELIKSIKASVPSKSKITILFILTPLLIF